MVLIHYKEGQVIINDEVSMLDSIKYGIIMKELS